MDLSKLSDAELAAMAGDNASPFGGMSDEELAAIAGDPAPAAPRAATGGAPAASAAPAASGQLSDAGRVGGFLTRYGLQGAVQGVAGLPAMVGDSFVGVGRDIAYGGKLALSKTGAVEAPDPKNYYGEGSAFPATEAVSRAAEATGRAATGGTIEPQGPGERIAAKAIEGATGALTGAGAGAVVARTGSALAQRVGGFLAAQPGVQAAAGAASGAASQSVGEAGGTPAAQMAAGVLAGAGTGFLGAKATQGRARPVPTTEDLRAAKTAAYDRAEAAGVQFRPEAVRDLDSGIRQSLPGEGIFMDTNPAARRVVDPLTRSHMPDASGQRSPVSLTRMDDIRKQAGKLSRSADPVEQRTGAILARRVDEFLDDAPSNRHWIAGGDPDAGIPALREAQAGNRRYAKASALDEALEKADRRTSRTGTGSNGENVDRQNISRLLDNRRTARQFDPHEREMMEEIVRGSRTQNALRFGSRFAPQGTVSGALGILAASQGYGLLPFVGYTAKGAGSYLHNRKIRRLEDVVKGGPGAGRRPSANYGANTARGAAQGFLAGSHYR